MTLALILSLKHTMIHIYFPKSNLRRTVIYNIIIIKFHQVLIKNDLYLDINAKLDLESQKQNQK